MPRSREAAAFALALCSLLLGFVDWGAYLSVPPRSPSNPLAPEGLWKTLWPLLGGAVLAILLGRWGRAALGGALGTAEALGLARRTTVALGAILERTDRVLRLWPVAGLSLLVLAIAFGAAMEFWR